MLNILGGNKEDSYMRLVEIAEKEGNTPTMDTYVHLYGKASKPSRKIGHITMVGWSTMGELLAQSPLQKLLDTAASIREERVKAAAQALRPSNAPPASKPAPSGSKPLILVTMGSDSDLPVLKAGLDILEEFGVPYAVNITSAHRTPSYMGEVAKQAAGEGIKVIIAAAGGAAHLPGMMASHTPLPVIGVPVKATHLDGQDSLLSIVQMPVRNFLVWRREQHRLGGFFLC
jgi:phosphoribosylaminoimidazole carboxylase